MKTSSLLTRTQPDALSRMKFIPFSNIQSSQTCPNIMIQRSLGIICGSKAPLANCDDAKTSATTSRTESTYTQIHYSFEFYYFSDVLLALKRFHCCWAGALGTKNRSFCHFFSFHFGDSSIYVINNILLLTMGNMIDARQQTAAVLILFWLRFVCTSSAKQTKKKDRSWCWVAFSRWKI